MAPLEFRRARPQEWEQARDLRLEMLQDTPLAYLERLEEARATPALEWQQRHARRTTADHLGVLFVAVDEDGYWRGQAATMVDRFSQPARVWLGAVYVAPSHRGGAVAEKLVSMAEDWAGELGFDQIWLEVHQHNARAIRFYQRTGWQFSGAHRPYPLDPRTEELEMVKRLNPS